MKVRQDREINGKKISTQWDRLDKSSELIKKNINNMKDSNELEEFENTWKTTSFYNSDENENKLLGI